MRDKTVFVKMSQYNDGTLLNGMPENELKHQLIVIDFWILKCNENFISLSYTLAEA